MPLTNCRINLIPTWPANFVIIADATEDQILTFSLTDTKRYVPVVTLSIQDNMKLL